MLKNLTLLCAVTFMGALVPQTAFAVTRLFIKNNTNWNFTLGLTQEGVPLKAKYWQAKSPAVAPDQQVEIGSFSRGSGIKRGKRYLFRTYATAQLLNGESCQIELLQYLRGTLFHSHLWQGARSNVYDDPGLRDDRALGRTFTQCQDRAIVIEYQAKKTNGDDDIYYSLTDAGPIKGDDVQEKSNISLMTYNVYMRPTEFFSNNQKQRADAIANTLSQKDENNPIDALILSEVFDDDIRNYLVNRLKPIFPYASKILGSDRVFEQDGGVIILTKGPILFERETLFGSLCSRTFEDCLSDKGGVYVTTLVRGVLVNIIGTHLQAGNEKDDQDVRKRQVRYLETYNDIYFNSPGRDKALTLFGGDFNINIHGTEYAPVFDSKWHLPEQIGTPTPNISDLPEETSQFKKFIQSFDPRFNRLAGEGGQEWLDYFVIDKSSAENLTNMGQIKVEFMRSQNNLELSDHFPVRFDIELD